MATIDDAPPPAPPSESYRYTSDRTQFAAAMQDVREGARLWRTWTYLAWMNVLRSKRRAWLGALWYPLALCVTVWVVGPLFGILRGYSAGVYVPYFAMGLVAFQVSMTFLTRSSDALVGSGGQIKNSALPYSFYLFRHAAQQLILSAMYVPVIATPFLFLNVEGDVQWFGLLGGLFAFYATLIALSFPLSIIFTRFLDLTQLVRAATRLIFLVTPIIWFVDELRVEDTSTLSGKAMVRAMFVDFNPLYHLIDLVRAPALGGSVSALTMAVTFGMFVLGVVGFLTVFIAFRRRIVYWL